jgi:outer membrane protein TolC
MGKNRFTFQFVLLSLILLFSVTCISTLKAQKKVKYTLNEVIKIAQRQSPDALMAIHRFRSEYWRYRSFKADYLPNLSLSATLPDVNRSINAISSQDGTINYTPQSITNYSLDVSLRQKIGLTGGEVFINSGIAQMDNFLPDTTRRQFLSNIVNIGIRQPIFSYNKYKWDKKINPLEYEQAKRKYLESSEDIAIKAIDYFFALLSAQIEKEIAEKNYHNYDTLYHIAQGRYNLGKIAENDLLQLELNLLKADASVENAELNYDNRLFLFKSFLRLKDTLDVELIPPAVTPYFDIPVQKAIELAKLNTSEGMDFQKRILQAESQLDMAKMNGRFDANFFASFGLTQTAATMPDAYKNPLDGERVSLGITLPILDWGKARGQIKMAESNLDLVQTAVQQDKLDFEQNIYLQIMQFKMQKKQLFIAAKSDTVAQKRYEVTHKRYMIGKINNVLDLNMAQIDNDNARKSYFNSLSVYWKNYYRIRKMTLFDFENNRPLVFDTDLLIK